MCEFESPRVCRGGLGLPAKCPHMSWAKRLSLVLMLWMGTVSANGLVMPYVGQTKRVTPPLNREELREIFFARQNKWTNGTPIRAFVLPDGHPLHVRFAKEVLGVYPYQLRSAWDRMLFSGTGVPPRVVESVEEMRRRVDGTQGGIGYVVE